MLKNNTKVCMSYLDFGLSLSKKKRIRAEKFLNTFLEYLQRMVPNWF